MPGVVSSVRRPRPGTGPAVVFEAMLRALRVFGVASLALVSWAACSPGSDVDVGAGEADGGTSTTGSSSGGSSSSSSGSTPGVDGSVPEPERCASPPCANGELCKDGVDCESGLCIDRKCFPGSAADGVRNGGETDVDCGGPPDAAPRCADGKACAAGADCKSLSCGGGTCQPATSTDAIKNGTESDVDCGGGEPTNAPRCADGKKCGAGGDCESLSCQGGTCAAPSGADGVKNGTETDVDCGGGAPTNARRCNTGESCGDATDCNNVLCTNNKCAAATSSDGLKNGTESDVDCGGGAPTNAPACGNDLTCTTHGDCASGACAISGPKAGKCVPFKSCVKNEGGYTCGRDDRDFGGADVALESCCDVAPIDGSAAKMNRFAITAGRMRAFIDRLGGNVRGWVQNAATKPPGWSSSWDVLVPSNVAEAEIMLGPYWNGAPNDPNITAESPHSKRSCGYDNFNGHTYWVSTNQAEQLYSQAVLDTKVLNCVGWHLVTAFCAWDGGRLATVAELRNVFTNGNTTTYPWLYPGSPYTGAYVATAQDERLNHVYNYGFPGNGPPAVGVAKNRITWWLSPPGRFWRGWNKNGIEIAGNVLYWTSDKEYNFAWNYSFENHQGTMNNGGDWRTPNDRSDVPNGYYALGARCVYP